MNDKVSIIMSTHDTPLDYLDDSIDSILKQTYSNFEFIIVCDGSKKDYQYILANYKDERIKVLLNEENKGLASSLNRGISESSGQYIARMDSDDISLPNRIEEELRFLKKNDLDICGSAAYLFGDKYGKKSRLFNAQDDLKVWVLFMTTLIHPTVIGKSKVFKENKYNNDFTCSQDFELWSRLIEHYNIGFYNKPLIKYRVHNKQASIEKSRVQSELAKIVVKSNASKIDGKYDEKVFKCLWLLGGREKITKSNCREFSQLIDYVLEKNRVHQRFNEKSMERIFYNRFFELTLKYKTICFDCSSLKKTIHLYNFGDLIIHSSNVIIGKLQKIVRS